MGTIVPGGIKRIKIMMKHYLTCFIIVVQISWAYCMSTSQFHTNIETIAVGWKLSDLTSQSSIGDFVKSLVRQSPFSITPLPLHTCSYIVGGANFLFFYLFCSTSTSGET